MNTEYRQVRDRNLRRGFTLVELLVVIAILSILAGLLLPLLKNAIGQARSIACLSQLKQIGMGLSEYSNQWNGYVCPTSGHIYTGQRWWDWWVGRYYYEYPVTASNWCPNLGAWPGFHCPEDSTPRHTTWDNRTYAVSRVLMNGPGNLLADQRGMRLSEIKKPSSTYFLCESDITNPLHELNVVITSGSNSRVLACDGTEIFPWHNGKSNILFVDNHAVSRSKWNTGTFSTLSGIEEP
jgi:prepilin-type N-terminal cleavage/methylation domain-containing protein/prepilin-type processing-associated H-X9-DG protein